ncbi:tRNA pseudouridine(55) synthase TruB [Paenibacillus sp. GSMTC-2017]|uniref:tRNA pseudouridine(55) synthase TruB n=1 Tax=Paenibacillus sp. GSMTC-2017 TaxID=2794350 RepID=UPI0018D9FDFA|nr:tRNA pseudouridine(55) synthase TruB [Paenibacillus sp. GSMTC-2017]MBH5316594.1 tRNA pseudouridine(55) synthase TruB [Paenibacillus sp. GSMTC-2017]
MDGILAVWKPAGWTSHDVVAKVRRLLKMKRIGHAGTLDPMVTGVLPLCLGRSTRVVEYVQERPKAYEAVLKLGIATDTEDMSGEIIERKSVGSITEADIESALNRFAGEIDQIPPMFSALKVDGKRLYELAREGKTVERKSRTVTIYDIKLIKVDLELDEPEITFSAVCSKGTYIRTLCVDIGKALGLPATMAKLTRTMSGGIEAESCLTLEQIEALLQEGKLEEHLIAADEAITHIDKAQVSLSTAVQVLRGQKVPLSQVIPETGEWKPNGLLRVYDTSNLFLGIFQSNVEGMLLKPVKVFN